ncbi:MAG: phage holin family protein [Verrucomicrobia bacterium]|nr:phage holin family protein [Verrucomicrobiota bacterium]
MQGTGESREGVLASLGRLLKTVLAIAENRLDLLLVELKEEHWRFFDALLLAGLVLILLLMTLIVPTVTVIVLCVRTNQFGLLAALGLLYLAATMICFLRLRSRLKNWAPFSATLSELKKDKACLDEKS